MNVHRKRLLLDDGTVVTYDKCLLATGGAPRSLQVVSGAPDEVRDRVTLFRRAGDFRRLDELTRASAKHVVVIGGGFLGSELAVALAQRGKATGLQVTQVYPESGNMAKVLPEYLSAWSTNKVRQEGVSIIPGARVTRLTTVDSSDGTRPSTEPRRPVSVELDTGDQLLADEVALKQNRSLVRKLNGFGTWLTLAK